MPEESVMWGIERAARSERSVAVEIGMMTVGKNEKSAIYEMESR